MTAPSTASAPPERRGQGHLAKVLKYAGGSVIATGCSEAVFVLMYGVLDTSTTWASIVSWFAGALPNYWMNRRWAWQRSGRPNFKHEVLPYGAIVLVTLVLATVLTGAAHALFTHFGVSASARVALVAITFLGVYGVMFILRYVLFDRLFARLERLETAVHADPTSLRSGVLSD